MTLSLATRRASFLSLPQWLNPPWKDSDAYSLNPLQTLIDSAILLPGIMDNWDRSTRKLQLTGADIPMSNNLLTEFIEDALRIQRAITDWEIDLRGGDDKSQLYIARLSKRGSSSGAEESPEESGNIFPISYTFPSFDLAAAIIYYETVHILLNGFLIEMVLYAENSKVLDWITSESAVGAPNIRELTMKSLECADRICSSLEYFFERDKRMIGRIVILSPFEAARGLYARLQKSGTGDPIQDAALVQKMNFCESVVRRIEAEGLLLGWSE